MADRRRRAALFPAVLALALACASPGVPPGGPEDIDAPSLVGVRPDTGAVNVRVDAVGLDFDDVVSERPQGAPNLAELFVISPSLGRNALSWRRTRLAVRPREGFRPNTTYRVTMLPGLVDLDGNVDTVGHTLVFSTGPTIATGAIKGRVFEWLEERVARRAWVEAVVLPDSLRYLAVADSLGWFELRNMPPGRYLLRGIVDGNNNRQLDPRELHDTATVVLQDSTERTLYAIVRDTLGPGIQTVEVVDSLTIRIRFDHPLDTAFAIAPAWVRLLRVRDSTAVPLAGVIGAHAARRAAEDSVRAKARADSIRLANDTTRRDTTRTPPPPVRPPAPRPARPAAPPRDTTPPPRPTVTLPEQEVVVRLPRPLEPSSNFVLRVEGVRGITGHRRDSERRFQTPRAPRRDSTRTDTARATRTDTARTRRDTLFGLFRR